MSGDEAAKGPPPPAELVRGEVPFWKMADVKGILVRHLITGYMITSYRCFVWDVESDTIEVNVPVDLADVTIDGRRPGKRTRRGGAFIVPETAEYVPPRMGERVEVGDLHFRVNGEPVMVFREVSEPLKVKTLIDFLRAQVKANAAPPRGLGVDALWRGRNPPGGDRTRYQ